jgi:hypothetical protein
MKEAIISEGSGSESVNFEMTERGTKADGITRT